MFVLLNACWYLKFCLSLSLFFARMLPLCVGLLTRTYWVDFTFFKGILSYRCKILFYLIREMNSQQKMPMIPSSLPLLLAQSSSIPSPRGDFSVLRHWLQAQEEPLVLLYSAYNLFSLFQIALFFGQFVPLISHCMRVHTYTVCVQLLFSCVF